MESYSPNGYVGTNTIIFAQSVIQSLEDMIGIPFELNKASFKEVPFSSQFNMIACIHFSGVIQGDYILALDEIMAAKLADIYEEGMSDNELREMRDEYSGMIKELLNIAVGQSITELEQSFGDLTYTPCTMIYGEIEFPDFLSGNMIIEGDTGKIQCGFSLNLARLKIGQRLEEALHEVEKKMTEASKARKEVKTILQLVPSGLVAVSSEGKILPGYSRATASVVGHDTEKEIIGSDLGTLMKLKPDDSLALEKFFLLFKKNGSFPLEGLMKMCEGEFVNQDGKIFKLDWLPVVNDESESLEKLLVIIKTRS
ncbi:hypothetical protein QUF80_14720 [Desulfococcaceae bacterium HSG8]|nr:hypothetical protein [Desulfococcaceae bacterium HSG8]